MKKTYSIKQYDNKTIQVVIFGDKQFEYESEKPISNFEKTLEIFALLMNADKISFSNIRQMEPYFEDMKSFTLKLNDKKIYPLDIYGTEKVIYTDPTTKTEKTKNKKQIIKRQNLQKYEKKPKELLEIFRKTYEEVYGYDILLYQVPFESNLLIVEKSQKEPEEIIKKSDNKIVTFNGLNFSYAGNYNPSFENILEFYSYLYTNKISDIDTVKKSNKFLSKMPQLESKVIQKLNEKTGKESIKSLLKINDEELYDIFLSSYIEIYDYSPMDYMVD